MITLGSICSFLNGGTPSRKVARYYQGDVPWITGADISGPGADTARSFITEEAIRESATNRVPAGTVLLVTRTSVGKVAVAAMELCFSQDITAITPDPHRLDTSYLVHFLRTQQPHLERLARGATIKGVTREAVANLQIPLPSLLEQRRIASIVDKADALRALRRVVLVWLDMLTQSIFLDMFGDPATNPKGWPVRTIGDLLESATYGTSQKAEAAGEYPVLRMNNITRTGEMDFAELKYLDLKEDQRERYLVRTGDVLFNRTNSTELVGKTAIYRGSGSMAYAGYLIRLRVNREHESEYLAAFLNTAYSKRVLRSRCKSIIGMANINATELQGLRIPIPPHSIQHEFAGCMRAVAELKATQHVSLVEQDDLLATLQQRAFRGGL